MTRPQSGKRSYTKTSRKRGRYISARPAEGSTDIAFDATFRAAAPHQVERESEMAVAIEMQDLQKKVRVRRAAYLVLFVVDASWSMAAAERMIASGSATANTYFRGSLMR